MSDLQQKLQVEILGRLNRRKNQQLTRGDFDKAADAIKKRFETDDTAIEQAIEAMRREQYVSRTTRDTYKLEKKGADYFTQLELKSAGPTPEINEEMLGYQKAFVLMTLFSRKDRSMTQSDLRKSLSSAAAQKALLFARLSSDPVVNPDLPTMDWVIHQLVRAEDVTVRRIGQGARYTLTDRGQESLVATDQHPSLKFRLEGQQLNALREAIRDASSVVQPQMEPRKETAPSRDDDGSPSPIFFDGRDGIGGV